MRINSQKESKLQQQLPISLNNQFFTVKIPVTPYHKFFLENMYGNPIYINNYHIIGVTLISLLNKESFTTSLSTAKKESKLNKLTEHLICKGRLSMLDRLPFNVTDDKAIQLNRFFDEIFTMSLHLHVRSNINHAKKDKGRDDAIFQFAQLHGIEIGKHISYECIEKKEGRLAAAMKEKTTQLMSIRNTQTHRSTFI